MARRKQVTRTLQVNGIKALCVDITTNDVEEMYFIAIGKIREKDYLKIAKRELETDTLKVVHILDVDRTSGIYGMSEIDFYNNSQLLPPR